MEIKMGIGHHLKEEKRRAETCCVCVQLDECFHADRRDTIPSFREAAAPTVQHFWHPNENWERKKERDNFLGIN